MKAGTTSMPVVAFAMFGVFIGLAWVVARLGECDTADCSTLHTALHDSWFIGFALVIGSTGTLAEALLGRLLRRGPRSEDSPAWPLPLVLTSACLSAAVALAVVGGGVWSAITAAVGVVLGLLIYGARRPQRRGT